MAITINAVSRRKQYTSSGSLGPYAFSFKILDATDIAVYVGTTLKTVTTHYTTAYNTDGTGSITFTSGNAPANGTIVTLESNQAIERTSDYTTGGDLKADSLNDDLDRLAINDQQLETQLSLNVQLDSTANRDTSSDGIGPLKFPYADTVGDQANKLITYDSAGTSLVATQEIGVFKGNWAASTAYVQRDIVKDTATNNIFLCNTAHTSSGSQPLTSNTDAAKWDKIVDAAAATTSQTAAASSATAAASSASAASSSQSAAASSASTASTQATNSSNSATASAASATAAEASAGALAFKYTFDNSTTMADPGTGEIRFNHGTISSVTQIAIDSVTADTGSPDISDFIASIDDGTNSTHEGFMFVRKSGTPATFAIFNITSAVTDSGGHLTYTVTHSASNGTISNGDTLYISFTRSGNVGAQGIQGPTGATGPIGPVGIGLSLALGG